MFDYGHSSSVISPPSPPLTQIHTLDSIYKLADTPYCISVRILTKIIPLSPPWVFDSTPTSNLQPPTLRPNLRTWLWQGHTTQGEAEVLSAYQNSGVLEFAQEPFLTGYNSAWRHRSRCGNCIQCQIICRDLESYIQEFSWYLGGNKSLAQYNHLKREQEYWVLYCWRQYAKA